MLIVDDHPSFRRLARRLLETAGFRVLEAPDGEQALAAAATDPPDLVLLDIQLPGLDGFEVAERLAAGGDGPTVVLISSREAADYGDRMATPWAAGFVPKAELSMARLEPFLRTGP